MIKHKIAQQLFHFLLAVLLINTPLFVFANDQHTAFYLQKRYHSTAPPLNQQANYVGDLQTNSQHLTLVRIKGPVYLARPGTLGIGWRSNFDFALLKTAPQYQVMHPDGTIDTFTVSKPGMIGHTAGARLFFIPDQSQMQYRNDAGLTVTFQGSFPVAIQHNNKPPIQLSYRNKRLTKVSVPTGDAIQFDYLKNNQIQASNDRGERVIYQLDKHAWLKQVKKIDAIGTSNITAIEADASLIECPANSANQHALCQNNVIDYQPYQFVDALSIHFAQQMDIRPSSCGSFFDEHSGTQRGFNIENGFSTYKPYAAKQQTVSNFPVVDFLANGEAKIMSSRNLLATSYGLAGQSDALYKKLLQDAEAISTKLLEPLEEQGYVTATANGETTTLYPSDIQNLVLELVIQHGVASADQIAQMQRAKRYLLQHHGVRLNVIEIP